jgi:hypothetical protein
MQVKVKDILPRCFSIRHEQIDTITFHCSPQSLAELQCRGKQAFSRTWINTG